MISKCTTKAEEKERLLNEVKILKTLVFFLLIKRFLGIFRIIPILSKFTSSFKMKNTFTLSMICAVEENYSIKSLR